MDCFVDHAVYGQFVDHVVYRLPMDRDQSRKGGGVLGLLFYRPLIRGQRSSDDGDGEDSVGDVRWHWKRRRR